MDRPAKLRRLNELKCTLPHISQSALGALLDWAKTNTLPAFTNRNHVREARNAQLEQATPFGPLIRTCQLPGVDGRPVDIDIQCPFGMLHVCAKTKYFGALLSSAAARSPPTFAKPWRIIIYSDEITPGNSMKPQQSHASICVLVVR